MTKTIAPKLTKPTYSTRAWMLVHVIFPLLPFTIEGMTRFLILGWRLDTFSSATLSASMALICFFIYQSLIAHHYPIQNDDEEEQRVGWSATLFQIFAIFSIALFTAVVLLSVIVETYHVAKESLPWLQVTTLIVCFIPVPVAYQTQKSFKLRAIL
jgi:hypothetical protein